MARAPGAIDVLGMLNTIQITIPVNHKQISRKRAYEALRKHFGATLTDSELSKKLDSLKRRGYIRIYNNDYRSCIEFTEKARIKIVENISVNLEPDGDFRFISFDVPEDKSYGRDMFRKKIKKVGAIQLQKSLWVCDHDIGEVVEMASREYEIDEYVVYIVAKKTDIDKTLNEIFKNCDQ